MKREIWSALGAAAAVILLGACSDGISGLPAGATVHVELSEWKIVPDRNTVNAGTITFIADNKGADTHELILLRTDRAADDLPLDAKGDVDPAGAGVQVISEVKSVAPGASGQFRLDDAVPGKYVFVCNLATSNGTAIAHPYAKGMRSSFTITEAPGQE